MTQSVPAEIGAPIDDILTPALVVELDAFERNLDKMSSVTTARNVRCRPHAKTHKCSQIARLQLARGAVGVCCQTVGEAEVMAAAGIPDILVTNQIIEERRITRALRLAKRCRLGLCVDESDGIPLIASLAAQQGVTADIYVEIDVGSARCGIAPGPTVVELATRVREFAPLRFAGLHCYNGKIQSIRAYPERFEAAAAVATTVSETVTHLQRRNIDCPVLTGGGTGTFEADIAAGVLNEVQPGSYIFFDADYAQIDPGPGTRFESSLFVLARVISRPTPHRVIINAGLKALAFDHGPPTVLGNALARYHAPNDEHGRIDFTGDITAPSVGALVTLVPSHCDPTVNLYDWIVAVRQHRIEAIWSIDARGAF